MNYLTRDRRITKKRFIATKDAGSEVQGAAIAPPVRKKVRQILLNMKKSHIFWVNLQKRKYLLVCSRKSNFSEVLVESKYEININRSSEKFYHTLRWVI